MSADGWPDMPCEDCEQGLSTCCIPPAALLLTWAAGECGGAYGQIHERALE